MATAAFDAAALEVRNREEGLLQPRCCCPGSLVCRATRSCHHSRSRRHRCGGAHSQRGGVEHPIGGCSSSVGKSGGRDDARENKSSSSRKYDPVSALSLQSTSMPFHLNLIRMRAALVINDRFATITQPFPRHPQRRCRSELTSFRAAAARWSERSYCCSPYEQLNRCYRTAWDAHSNVGVSV